ncbi:MAG: DUF4258 domain-containing protein [Bacteroidota bacterium]
MDFEQIVFSRHAISRMFEQSISVEQAKKIVRDGKKIHSYPDDKPYPSYLYLGFEGDRPIHVVAAYNQEENLCIVVTVYEPDPSLWSKDFTTKIIKL